MAFSGAPQSGNTSSATIVRRHSILHSTCGSDGTGVPATGGVLYAVDVKTGEQRWRTPQLLNTTFFPQHRLWIRDVFTPAVLHGIMYVLDAKDGREIMRFNAGRPIMSSPVIVENVLYSALTMARSGLWTHRRVIVVETRV
jgi:outer membrane protein assembly factor BamB